MDLHDHPAVDSLASYPGVHLNHCALDDVRGGALHRRIDRSALCILAAVSIARIDLR